MATITQTLSEWAANLRYEDLAGEAVEAAKRFLYDSIGCALGGCRHEECGLLLAHLKQMGGKPDCTLNTRVYAATIVFPEPTSP